MTLDGEKNLCKPRSRSLAIPIALQFTDELDPAGRFTASLLQPSKTSFVRFHRCSRNAIDHGINLEALGNGVKGGVYKANLGPECCHDHFLAAGRLDGAHEILVFRSID